MLLSAPNQKNSTKTTQSVITSSNVAHSQRQTGGMTSDVRVPPSPKNTENVSTTKHDGVVSPTKKSILTQSVDPSVGTAQSQAAKVALKLKQHRDKVWDLLIKSWRSIAISICFLMMYGEFWVFNLIAVIMMKGVGPDTPWVQNWYGCVLQGNSRKACAAVAAPYAPPLGAMVYANIAVNFIGFSGFLIFGLAMIDDWKQLLGLKR
ncbi:hypothetical protein BC830DRAFT_1139188 [Chytriomyces sp. MP71]|nr:hypothetical protein BC830DRAFT_1139188 [Chytriomyces sp. MP71]